jgi:hypothetical protein
MSHTTFTGGLGYEGKVTLTLKNNNHVLKSKVYKNKGTSNLFEFLGYCLIDAYEDVKKLLPSKIRLLYNNGEHPEFADPKAVVARTLPQERAQTPTVVVDSNNAQVKVTYSFEVSKAAIAGNFNQIALYGAGIDDFKEFSAYYFLTDARGDFEIQDIRNWSATTVLLIDWELTLSNKNVETRNN